MAKKKKAKSFALPPNHPKSWGISQAVKGLLIFILAIAVLGVGLFLNQPEDRKVFEKTAIKSVKENQKIFFLVSQANINADYYDVCQIQMSGAGAYNAVRLFFISPYNKQYSLDFSYDFDSGRPGKINSRLINLRRHPAWNGMIKELLILPNDPQDRVEQISFMAANPWSRFRAGWEDFIIFHDPLLGTCFTLASPIFWGRFFNPFWVPILLALLALTFLASLLARDRKFSWWVGLPFWIVILLLWAILDIRNGLVYFKNIQRDINLYWGHTLEQKRGTVTGSPDFVKFISFCDREIPQDARVGFHISKKIEGTPDNYLASTQTGFLFHSRSGKGKAFFPVYGMDFHQDKKLAQLKVFKQFGPQAFILSE